jgi:hypothetical protein
MKRLWDFSVEQNIRKIKIRRMSADGVRLLTYICVIMTQIELSYKFKRNTLAVLSRGGGRICSRLKFPAIKVGEGGYMFSKSVVQRISRK